MTTTPGRMTNPDPVPVRFRTRATAGSHFSTNSGKVNSAVTVGVEGGLVFPLGSAISDSAEVGCFPRTSNTVMITTRQTAPISPPTTAHRARLERVALGELGGVIGPRRTGGDMASVVLLRGAEE